ncbi:hypothetical protein H5410_025265 [Solanum commersonii]|uniref:Uncharacterized protein n=1 Tax=Solanum commersonii TaxID=4109 RepID=A0A9J5YVA6_SOLCO|nr:hypothetical protein H5410_025265 [Solanum commersonii]
MVVSPLLFGDDALVFSDANEIQQDFLGQGSHYYLPWFTLGDSNKDLGVWNLIIWKAPVTVIGKLEILQRNFLSDAVDGTKEFHLVRWETMASPKQFLVEEESLWRELIMDKYGVTKGGWRTNGITMSFGCGAGDGSRVRFRGQIWCGGVVLKDDFLVLYREEFQGLRGDRVSKIPNLLQKQGEPIDKCDP